MRHRVPNRRQMRRSTSVQRPQPILRCLIGPQNDSRKLIHPGPPTIAFDLSNPHLPAANDADAQVTLLDAGSRPFLRWKLRNSALRIGGTATTQRTGIALWRDRSANDRSEFHDGLVPFAGGMRPHHRKRQLLSLSLQRPPAFLKSEQPRHHAAHVSVGHSHSLAERDGGDRVCSVAAHSFHLSPLTCSARKAPHGLGCAMNPPSPLVVSQALPNCQNLLD